jgi:site-specific DNA-methyltransferase (adenine-specific)
MIKLYNGDCLEEHKKVEDESVDLILIDPPYGTMKGAGLDGWKDQSTEWDVAIEPNKIFEIAERVLRRRGRLIVFSQQPYTTELIKNDNTYISHSYNMIWQKDHFANGLIAKKAPVNYYEDIVMFIKNIPAYDFEGAHPLREYALKIKAFTNYSRNKFYKKLGCGGAQHFLESNKENSQFSLCTSEIYHKLIEVFNIDKMEGFKNFEELKEIDDEFKTGNDMLPSTFNLWQGKKFKSNIFNYKKDYTGHHPTQKPVALLEYLIKTYTNENDTVLDFTMGSGSTGVACMNLNRHFIGIELDKDYFDIAKERMNINTLREY